MKRYLMEGRWLNNDGTWTEFDVRHLGHNVLTQECICDTKERGMIEGDELSKMFNEQGLEDWKNREEREMEDEEDPKEFFQYRLREIIWHKGKIVEEI